MASLRNGQRRGFLGVTEIAEAGRKKIAQQKKAKSKAKQKKASRKSLKVSRKSPRIKEISKQISRVRRNPMKRAKKDHHSFRKPLSEG